MVETDEKAVVDSRVNLPCGEKLRIWWRSHFVQATQNETGLQNLGALFCLESMGRKISDQEERKTFKRRQLQQFNSNPFIATLGLGALARLESEILAGDRQISDETATKFRHAVSGPLGSCGDELFWASIRPAAGALAIVIGLIAGPSAAVLTFLVVFGICQEWYRWHGIGAGFVAGLNVAKELRSGPYRESLKTFHTALGLCVGAVGGYLAVSLARGRGTGEMLIWAAAAAAGIWGFRRVQSATKVMFGALVVALILMFGLPIANWTP